MSVYNGDVRMGPISEADLNEEQRAAAQKFEADRGYKILGPFHVMMRSPQVMLRAQALGHYLRYDSILPDDLNEYTILLAAREWRQSYEWNAHRKHALKAGVDAALLDELATGVRPAALSDDQAIIYDFCEELHRDKGVSDATYARAVERFGEQGVIEIIGIQGYYSMLAMMMNTARTALPEGAPRAFE